MENFNIVPDKGTFGGSVEVVNQNFLLAQQEMEYLRQLYNNLQKSQPIPVTQLPATGEAGKIYRLAGATSYADYMWNGTQFIKMAEYNNAIDDEPIAGSNNLVKSGGVYLIKEETLEENRKMVDSILEDYAPVVITGDVNNAADEEDLISVNVEGTDVLKFKDKIYNPLVYSGLGRKILRKNIVDGVNTLTQSMINQANTIYVIQYDYTLNGNSIALPSACVLEFDGGHITGGTLTGTVLNESLNIDNFTLNDDATEALQNCVNICGTVVGSNKKYKVSRIININRALTLKGENLRLYSETPLNFFNVNSDNVTISGVDIKGVAEGYPDKDSTTAHASYLINIATGKKDITIKDCVLDSATGGVFVYPTCENITVTDCIMKNMVYIPKDISNPFAAGAGGYGVCLHSEQNNLPTTTVKITRNTFDNIHRHCAYVQVCKNVDFGYNTIVNSILDARFTCAVHQAGCDNLLVHDNSMYGGSNFVGLANYDTVQIPKAITNIYNNSLFGITMFAVAQMSTELQSGTIKGNYVELNNGCGLVCFGAGSKVEDYVISDNICNGNIVAQYYSLTSLGMVVFSATKSINGVIISNNKFNIGDGSVAYCPCVNVSYNKNITSPTLKCIQVVNNQFTNKCPKGRGLLLGDLSVINSFFAANNIIDTTYQAVEIQAVTIGNTADVVIKSNYYKGAMTNKGTVVDNIAIPS